MSEKKCKVCGAPAEWVYDDEPFCEICLCTELDIQEVDPPRRCEQCGTLLKGSYVTDDDDDNAFCSAKCALEYYDAKKLEVMEQEDDE